MTKKVYTTREVGNFCGVDLTTVINWINKGKLKAYKTAGGHRRITLKDLIKFMNEFAIPVPPEIQDRNRIKVLAAVDSPDILDLITQALKGLFRDCEFAVAVDAFEAGNKLAVFKPDIVILDLSLSGISECGILEKIRKIEKDVKILSISANENNGYREKALNAGSNGCIARPFAVNDFLSAVKKILK